MMARFSDIPLLPRAHYEVDVFWDHLERHLASLAKDFDLDYSPEYQRSHVWTRGQQVAYVEYVMKGGEVGRNLTWNCPEWESLLSQSTMELVDGKQRLEAVRAFLRDDFPAHGATYSEYEDRPRIHCGFKFRVCVLPTRAEVLQLYLNINAGGTPHTEEEIARVRAMLQATKEDLV